jgi:FixJ family two-component response regulator
VIEEPKCQSALLRAAVCSPIVLVDDDADLCLALSRLLRSAGFPVTTFASAEALLAQGVAEPPACMVVDIHLGGMSWLDLASQLESRGLKIPTIFITAHDNHVTRERVRRAGAAAYLPKPLDDQSLIEAIEKAIQSP